MHKNFIFTPLQIYRSPVLWPACQEFTKSHIFVPGQISKTSRTKRFRYIETGLKGKSLFASLMMQVQANASTRTIDLTILVISACLRIVCRASLCSDLEFAAIRDESCLSLSDGVNKHLSHVQLLATKREIFLLESLPLSFLRI